MPTMTQPPIALLQRLAAASVCVAEASGLVIREILKKGDLGVVDKGAAQNEDFDPQTEADRRAQQLIVATLSKEFPMVHLVGEEDDIDERMDNFDIQKLLRRVESNVEPTIKEILSKKLMGDLANLHEDEVTVWIDPLDGTREFTDGFHDRVTVLIGIAVQDEPVGGIIHQPFYKENEGRTLWGVKGIGYGGFTPPEAPTNTSTRRIAVTRTHWTDKIKKVIDDLKPTEIIKAGGAGNKIVMMLDGDADAYIYPSKGTKKWDTCAGEAILRMCGGALTDTRGKKYTYGYYSEAQNLHGVVAVLHNHGHYLKQVMESIGPQNENGDSKI
eukprot:Clim_evm135s210 gene=Clim_evmTU135s210